MYLVFVLDYSKGFGGKYGVQRDRQDKVGNSSILTFWKNKGNSL